MGDFEATRRTLTGHARRVVRVSSRLGRRTVKKVTDRAARAQSPQARRESIELLDRPKLFETYGAFVTPEMITARPITGLAKESTHIRREIVHFVDRVAATQPVTPLFLPGEPKAVVPAYVNWLGVDPTQVVTAGLGADVDVSWNYEEDPPAGLGPFALIVSQAMIEHLIDPYKHLRDLYSLLAPGGVMIVHTVTPGFGYHRHPVDCFRFFPDWFEEVADRLGATVTGRFVGDLRILYQFTKPPS
jgi:SAM-dependent methyltransferase